MAKEYIWTSQRSFEVPKEYPFYIYPLESQGIIYCDLYREDLKSMIDKIEKKREF